MNPLEVLAGLAEWATKDTAYNLDFIPSDRLTWKPAPTAKSALEMVNEMGQIVYIQTLLGDTQGHFDMAAL